MANRDGSTPPVTFTPQMNALVQHAIQHRSAPINMPGRRAGQTRDAEVTELLNALQVRLDMSVGSPDGEAERDNYTRSFIEALMEGLNPFRDTVSEDGVRSGELTSAIEAARNYLYPNRD